MKPASLTNFIRLSRTILVLLSPLSLTGTINAGQLFLTPAFEYASDVSGDGRVAVGAKYHWSPPSSPVLLNIPDPYQAIAASYDGSVIVGAVTRSLRYEAFRWSDSDGYQRLGQPGNDQTVALDVSNDGQIVVGGIYNFDLGIHRGFKWTASTGMVPLSYLPGTSPSVSGEQTVAHAISSDGHVIVGSSPDGARTIAVRWVDGQVSSLGSLPGSRWDSALDVSADGAVIVGRSGGAFNSGFRWTEAEGMVSLFPLTVARDVTADGSVVLGVGVVNDRSQPMMWDKLNGARLLYDVLVAEFPSLTGWNVGTTFFSDDGQVIVGGIVDPNGERFEFMAIIPEPSTLAMLLADLPLAYLAYRRRRST